MFDHLTDDEKSDLGLRMAMAVFEADMATGYFQRLAAEHDLIRTLFDGRSLGELLLPKTLDGDSEEG